MQSDPMPSQEQSQAVMPVVPALEPKSPKKRNILTIVLVAVLFFSGVALAGVSFWAYRLNTDLKSTKAALTALQGQYDSLSAEKNKLTSSLDTTTSDLNAAKTELEQAKKDLTNTQSELDKSRQEVSNLQTRTEKAVQYVDVLSGFFLADSTYTQHKRRVDKVGDSTLSELLEQWNKNVNDTNAWNDYVSYIIGTIMDSLK
jgi:septal ring factor EnvC (AmiA/AmiB activator)